MSKIKIPCKKYGGKVTLASWIVSHMPTSKFQVYVEPFCGSCSVLFAKPKSFIEIINDLDKNIINVFNQIREHPAELAALLWATPYSYMNWKEQAKDPDKLEQARLTIAKSFQFFCGNEDTSTWSIDISPTQHRPKPETWSDYFARIYPAAERLRTCEILSEDALKVIGRVASRENQSEIFLYVDPPYLNHSGEYTHKVDYEKMVDLIKSLKCKVMVSEYPESIKYFDGWNRVDKTVVSGGGTRAGKKNREKTEVLWLNY